MPDAARRALAAGQRFLFAAEDPRRLAALRIGLFSLLALRMATIDPGHVAGQPAALFDPVSLFHLLPQMPSARVASVVQPLAVVAALAAAAGLWPRLTFPAAFALALFGELMLNSTGKIIHNETVLMLCLLPLLATPSAASRAWSLRPGRSAGAGPAVAYGWPIRTAMVIVALAYLFVGLQKLRYSGVEWVTSENLRWVLYASSDAGREAHGPALFVAERAWLAHLLAAGTLALEIGFIACLRWASWRWVFVPGVVAMHLGIYLLMGLDYSAQALTVVLVFANWAVVADRLRRRRFAGARVTRAPAGEASA